MLGRHYLPLSFLRDEPELLLFLREGDKGKLSTDSLFFSCRMGWRYSCIPGQPESDGDSALGSCVTVTVHVGWQLEGQRAGHAACCLYHAMVCSSFPLPKEIPTGRGTRGLCDTFSFALMLSSCSPAHSNWSQGWRTWCCRAAKSQTFHRGTEQPQSLQIDCS